MCEKYIPPPLWISANGAVYASVLVIPIVAHVVSYQWQKRLIILMLFVRQKSHFYAN